jgi:hypothetical protein
MPENTLSLRGSCSAASRRGINPCIESQHELGRAGSIRSPARASVHLRLHGMGEQAAAWHSSDALNRGDLERVAHESVQ